jgi:hypothetical protein
MTKEKIVQEILEESFDIDTSNPSTLSTKELLVRSGAVIVRAIESLTLEADTEVIDSLENGAI